MGQQTTQADGGEQPTELADKHGGVALARDAIQASVTYTVELTDEQIEELPENISPKEFAANCALSRAEAEMDLTFSLHNRDAIAEEADAWDKNEYRVAVTFDQ